MSRKRARGATPPVMPPRLEIHVEGTGSVFRVAERAYVHLSMASTSTEQTEAFENAQATVTALTAHVRTLATKAEDGGPHPSAAVTAFTVTTLSTTSYYQRDKNLRELHRLPKEHRVSASAEIIFRDFVQLAETSVELANMPYLSINNTEWRLTDPTRDEMRREARIKAIEDAVQKANDYAGVVGRHVVAVEIKDGRSSYDGGYRMKQTARMTQCLPGYGDPVATSLDGPALEPKTITVSASINAKFVSNDGGEDEGMEMIGL